MSNNSYFYQDDPTQPARPYPPSAQGAQDNKLVLGNFQGAQQRPGRGQYQYPPSPQPAYPAQQPWQQGYPYPQPGGGSGPAPVPGRRPRRRRGCLVTSLVVVLLLVIIVGVTAFTAQRVLAFGSAISTQSPLSTQTGYMNGSGRVNLLVMGYGGSGHDGAYLTDSMIVMSLMPQSRHTTLISVPRDLWVQIPAGSGQYHKLNYAYVDGSNNGDNAVGGGNEAAQKLALVTGLDVKYWLTINFTGFTDFINSIGGVDVYVPDAFTANYPANDDPAINPNWTKVHFSKGMQHMDGKRAIEYARARYVLDNPAEGSDFARSARQQIIIKAALSKVKSISTWPKLYSALTALEHTIYTNMSLADLAQFALKMDLNNAHRVGISTSNVLVNSTASDGEAILLPANNDWQAITNYVKQQLYY